MFAFLSGSRRYLLFVVAALVLPTVASAQPSARSSARLVWDKTQNIAILFGGQAPADTSLQRQPLGDTWEWNGQRWIQSFPSVAPQARYGHVMIWDSTRDRIVVFGGGSLDSESQDVVLDDTWSYSKGVWTELSPAVSPTPKRYPAFAYDQTQDKLVVFGGIQESGGEWLSDTWEFDGSSWRQVAASGPKLESPIAVYDEKHEEILLLGTNEDDKSEMYRYVREGTWEKIVAPANLPECVAGAALTFMEHTHSVILVGGACVSPTDKSYEWDGTAWRDLEVVQTQGSVTAHSMTYDPIRQEIVLFGGSEFGDRGSTYRFRDNRWIRVTEAAFAPGSRSLMVLESDPVEGVIWMFGGFNETDTYYDLWKLSAGSAWTRVDSITRPSGCTYPVGAFDEARGRLVLLCEIGDGWEWDRSEWRSIDPGKTKPETRRFSSMLYNPVTKKSYVYGGFDDIRYKRNIWIWDGTVWSEVDLKSGPKNRMLSTFFYDPISKRMLMYGGIGRATTEDRIERFGDMWAFDGTKWTELKPATLPPARYGAVAKYDPVRGRILMVGGKSAEEKYLFEQWEWDGTTWKKDELSSTPDPRMNFGLGFDPVRQRMTLFGGWAGRYLSDTWYLTGDSWRPLVAPSPGRRRGASPSRSASSLDDRLRARGAN